MRIEREDLEDVVYGKRGWGRFTQDSPVMPDVWFGYGEDPSTPLDLLLQPYRGVSPGRLSDALRSSLGAMPAKQGKSPNHGLCYEERYVVVRLTLAELIRFALPLTRWWKGYTGTIGSLSAAGIRSYAAKSKKLGTPHGNLPGPTDHGVWFMQLAGALLWAGQKRGRARLPKLPLIKEWSAVLAPVLAGLDHDPNTRPLLWSLSRNRPASIAVWDSRKAIKADAADQIFALDAGHLAWGVFDTGIDARHTAFRRRDADGTPEPLVGDFAKVSRVRRTYDFTRIRGLIEGDENEAVEEMGGAAEFRRRLRSGRAIDWELIAPLLEIPHVVGEYVPPVHPHGTHVAGILGADWRMSDEDYDADDENDMLGMCPGIQLYDFRVLNDKGAGDEFGVLAALQFVRYLNRRSHSPSIHGVNLSLSIPHDVSNYACGRTPVCSEAERLQASGVSVVAAAGNEGYVHYLTNKGESTAYRNISITDPGNAEGVLTVGATHGRKPHTYGVSYFSSRGPTGDGRLKPDLVAPGEKIKGPAPGGTYERLDGTSMAAPHVSGAAALLMSRHPEFIGAPGRIKQILCDTATDLGRERYFQGAGLVDVCRAIQSV